MAIKVKLVDGNAEVGGDFNAALSFVKSVAGRKYDAATKTWTLPLKLADLMTKCEGRFPVEYSGAAYKSGRTETGHQTRYGNRYSDTEWRALQEARTARGAAEDALYDAVQEAERALRLAQMSILVAATGGNEAAAEKLYDAFVRVGGRWYGESLEEAEGCGAIRFTSDAKRQTVTAAIEAAVNHPLVKVVQQAERDVESAGDAAQAEVYEKYGVFQ